MLTISQCDGARPVCSGCHTKQLCCQYDVAEGVTRLDRLKLQKERQANRISVLESLFHVLRDGNSIEATANLARLRSGEGIEEIVKSLRVDMSLMRRGETEPGGSPMSSSYADSVFEAEPSVNGSPAATREGYTRHGEGPSMPMEEARTIPTDSFLPISIEHDDVELATTQQGNRELLIQSARETVVRTASLPVSPVPSGSQNDRRSSEPHRVSVNSILNPNDIEPRPGVFTTTAVRPNFESIVGRPASGGHRATTHCAETHEMA
jgi:hypothetical protein